MCTLPACWFFQTLLYWQSLVDGRSLRPARFSRISWTAHPPWCVFRRACFCWSATYEWSLWHYCPFPLLKCTQVPLLHRRQSVCTERNEKRPLLNVFVCRFPMYYEVVQFCLFSIWGSSDAILSFWSHINHNGCVQLKWHKSGRKATALEYSKMHNLHLFGHLVRCPLSRAFWPSTGVVGFPLEAKEEK